MKSLLLAWVLFAPQIALGDLTNVNVGSTPNDRTGDALRDAFIKLNANDLWLSSKMDASSNAIQGRVSGIMTNLASAAGVWLVHTNGTSTFYGTNGAGFVSAYNAATRAGETLVLGPGFYDLTNALSIDKPLSIIGAGSGNWNRTRSAFEGGTIIGGGLRPSPGMSNCLLAQFAMQGGGDIFFWSSWQTNVMNVRLFDLAVGSTSHTNAHNAEISGANILIETFRSYNAGANSIVMKGVSNVIARSLYSWNGGNSLYIKAMTIQKGPVHNVIVDGLISEDSSPVTIESLGYPGCTMRNVSIRNAQIAARGPGEAAFWIAVTRYCTISNLSVSGVQVTGGGRLATILPDGIMKDIRFADCDLQGFVPAPNLYPIFTFGTDSTNIDYSQVQARDVRVNSTESDAVGFFTRSTGFFSVPNQLDFFSPGILRDTLSGCYVQSGVIYMWWPTNYPLDSAYVLSGDPIWLPHGALAGVYTNYGVAVSGASDTPVPGIPAGSYYIACGPTSAPDGPKTADTDMRPGKILARLNMVKPWTVAEIDVRAGAENNIAQTLESGQARATCKADAQARVSGVSATLTATNAVIFPVYPWVWQRGGNINVGIFGGGATETSWYGRSRFNHSYCEITTRGAPMSMEQSATW